MAKMVYNFTEGHNKDIKDKVPDWMESLFKEDIKKQQPIIINDLYSSTTKNIKKCISCGRILNSNEISKCSKCVIIKK